METIKVLLNGLGKVGMLYDLDKSDTVLTHLKALDIHEKFFNVPLQVYVYDVDPSRKIKALEEKSNVTILKDFDNIPDNFFDLTILAVPIGSLSEQILYFDKNNLSKKIVVEKPGCQNIEELNNIKKIQNIDDYLRVGFQRRTLPMSKYIKNLFSNLNTTQLEYSFDIEFGGSFLNIASHFFDLIEYWIPNLTLIELHGNNLSGRLKFRKEECLVTINYKQTSDTNIEKNLILCNGPIKFLYSDSGRSIKFFDSKSDSFKFNLSSEFDNMLAFEAHDYLRWARGLGNSSMTSFNSSMLQQVILIGGNK